MTNAARPRSPEEEEPRPKPRGRRAWIWVAGWSVCFLALPGFLIGLLHQQRSRQQFEALPVVARSRVPVVPSWVPVKPDFRVEQPSSGGLSGNATLLSTDELFRVVLFYQNAFRGNGFEVSSNLMNLDDSISTAILSVSNAERGRFALVTLSKAQAVTRVEIAFSEKR
ncbi:MAG: hypothetical protein IANPNBLG_04974 [Bryobacteraceae bacterium]|nr:hypothetical protein [Bryobacteraceae bacterium]